MLLCGFFRLIRDSRGNIGVMTAILIIPVVGALGLATEASGWFLIARAEQSAADFAALAAAANNDEANGGTGYVSEAKAVASDYGFTDGSNNTTVSVAYQAVASAPNCISTNCYVVTITHIMPIYLSSIVGYQGNVSGDSGRGKSIAATAVAVPKIELVNYCIATGDPMNFTNDTGANFAGCRLRARGALNCSQASFAGAKAVIYNVPNQDNCDSSNCDNCIAQPLPYSRDDPFLLQLAALGSKVTMNLPTNPCTNYPQEGMGGPGSLPVSNQIGALTASTTVFCGDVALSGDITVSGAQNLLVIENGMLDLNGHTLTTATGAGLSTIGLLLG